jgi:S1-C subfamily serine protease
VVIQGKTDSGDVLGSGFIVSKDGKIVTNLHVIRDMKSASVQTATGEIFDSISVLATDERRDLAIVKIAGFGLPILDLGNSDALAVGEPVVIVGTPRGLEGTVTAGILSSVRDSGDGYKVLQTDAAVNPGNSGGPLLNSNGQAIGVVSFKLRSAEGLNFAVPINYVRGMLNNPHEPISIEQLRRSLVDTATTARQNNGPSLKETLDWLRANIPLGTVNYVQSADGAAVSTNQQLAVVRLDSCTGVIDSVVTMTFMRPDGKRGAGSYRYTIPFGSLTDASVEPMENAKETFVSGEQWAYRLILRSNSRNIAIAGYPPGSAIPETSITTGIFLKFNDESIAKRVAGAVKHVADLCRVNEPF